MAETGASQAPARQANVHTFFKQIGEDPSQTVLLRHAARRLQ